MTMSSVSSLLHAFFAGDIQGLSSALSGRGWCRNSGLHQVRIFYSGCAARYGRWHFFEVPDTGISGVQCRFRVPAYPKRKVRAKMTPWYRIKKNYDTVSLKKI
jgi:hypothetical protein